MESFFIIADEIQQLAMGKTMAVGIYADQVILLQVAPNHPPGRSPAMAKLQMMLTMRGLPIGEHDARAEIVFPDGTLGPKLRPVKVSALPGRSAMVIFAFTPFPLPQEGRYLLKLHVAGNTIENHFTVVHAAMPPEMAAAAGLPFSITSPAAPKGTPTVFNRPKPSATKVPAPVSRPVKRAASPVKKATEKAAARPAKAASPKAAKKHVR